MFSTELISCIYRYSHHCNQSGEHINLSSEPNKKMAITSKRVLLVSSFPLLQLTQAIRKASPSLPRFPGAAVGSLPLLRPLRRRKGGGTPDLRVWGVNRVGFGVPGGGACVGAAAAHSAFWSPRSVLPLVVVFCCGDGSVGVPPRGRLGDGGVRVEWGSRPSARLSLLRRFLRRRGGACKVCWRFVLSLDVSPVQGKWWIGGWSGAGRPDRKSVV